MAIGRAAEPGADDPTTAATDTRLPGGGPDRVDSLCVCVARKPVRTPFIDVAMHIIQAERVRLLLTDRVGRAAAVARVPGIFAQLRIVQVVAVAEPSL